MTAGCVGTGCRSGGGEREFVEYGPDMMAMVRAVRSEQPTVCRRGLRPMGQILAKNTGAETAESRVRINSNSSRDFLLFLQQFHQGSSSFVVRRCCAPCRPPSACRTARP